MSILLNSFISISGLFIILYISIPIINVCDKIFNIYFFAKIFNLLEDHNNFRSKLVNFNGANDNPGSLLIKSSFRLFLFSKFTLYLFKLPLVIIIDCNNFSFFNCLYKQLKKFGSVFDLSILYFFLILV